MKKFTVPALAAAVLSGVSAFAGGPAAPYDNTRIDARLNVAVKENTQVVHFVRDNADPNVLTKAYIVKHVDPYELRSYLRNIVQTRKVDSKNTNVEAVKFTDGTSVLLISAEDYRFNDTPNSQGFDSIVRELDKPKLVSSSGRQTYVYSPRYRSSAELLEMISQVGLYSKDAIMNNLGGTDVVAEDPGLNLLFFCTAPFSRRTIDELLKAYDKPTPAARARITVYELYAENDTKLGLDFQAWKNNEGINFFNTGGRFSQNYSGGIMTPGAKWNSTTYFQFNPKWNTKYIDFLTSCGKAKVVHTSELSLLNNSAATVSKTTQVFYAKATPIESREGKDYSRGVLEVKNHAAGASLGTDSQGRTITITADADVSIMKIAKDDYTRYTLKLSKENDVQFIVNGERVGKRVRAARLTDALASQIKDVKFGNQHGSEINLEASNDFGFRMTLTPSINKKASSLNVKIENSSLIGYTSDGTPRIQKGAKIDTDFMIANEGTKLVIGGIEKRSMVSVSGGIPILKDLPLLGWIFSTETEASKRSQLLVVAEIIPEKAAADSKPFIEKLQKGLKKAGSGNNYGYRQFFIDPERLK